MHLEMNYMETLLVIINTVIVSKIIGMHEESLSHPNASSLLVSRIHALNLCTSLGAVVIKRSSDRLGVKIRRRWNDDHAPKTEMVGWNPKAWRKLTYIELIKKESPGA